MKKQIDAPVAQLVLDLEERGLLDRTLIVLASEFSRDLLIEGKPDRKVKDQVEVPDVITEPKHYGMHRHFTDAGCVLLFGGGVRRGHLHGVTADERPCRTLQDRVVIEDLHATILRTLGITPTLAYDDRRTSVLRHPRRQGKGDQGITFVGAVGARGSTGATGALLRLQRRSSVAMDRRQAPRVTVNSSKIVVGHPRVRAPRHDRLGSRRAVAEARDERVLGP